MWQPGWEGRGVQGRMDTHMCKAEYFAVPLKLLQHCQPSCTQYKEVKFF